MENKNPLKMCCLLCFVLLTALACQNGAPPAATAPAGDPVVISYIEMFTQTAGWGIGGEAAPLNHILRTQDGAGSWTDVTPPESAPNPGDADKRVVAFFLDTAAAWATYAPQGTGIPAAPFIWYTTDGGASWTAGPPLSSSGEFYSPTFLYFVDAHTGWFVVQVGAGMSHEYTEIFKTQDGGVSWDKIIDPYVVDSPQSCCKTALAFADSQTGMFTAEQGAYADPYLEWTDDGGLTWQNVALPFPSSASGMLYCKGHSPHFFSSRSALLALDCRNLDTDTAGSYLYRTADGGAGWQISAYPGGELVFLGADEIFALGRQIHKTTDGGQTWTYVKTVCWDGQFSFVDADLAWAVGSCGDGPVALYHTVNGAASWNEILPVLQ
jgi:photosystem II stability/assembly factor-like uncharacterized protein